MKFIIYSFGYDHDIGGIIVLHKLCDQLNALGHRAFINPVLKLHYPQSFRVLYNLLDRFDPANRKAFKLNPSLRTPLRPAFDRVTKNTIVIYPEAISGNPLGAQNVVRWFLHHPGFHNPYCQYGPGEFQIDFNEFLKDYETAENYVSPHRLHVLHFPTDLYNLEGAVPSHARKGAAYCVRKGVFRPDTIDLTGSICIDGLPHANCAAIFKRVKYFYSFDPYTAYSSFAALCGATSIVLPPPGMAKSEWYSDETNRYGIGFGPDEEHWAVETRGRVLSQLIAHETASQKSVAAFVDEVRTYFNVSD